MGFECNITVHQTRTHIALQVTSSWISFYDFVRTRKNIV